MNAFVRFYVIIQKLTWSLIFYEKYSTSQSHLWFRNFHWPGKTIHWSRVIGPPLISHTVSIHIRKLWGQSWSWLYGSWIYNYNQCLSPLKLWVRIPLRRGALDTLCDKVCSKCVVISGYSSFLHQFNWQSYRNIVESGIKHPNLKRKFNWIWSLIGFC